MKLILAKHASEDRIESFLKSNPQIEKEPLIDSAYVVELKDKISGCFILQPIEERSFWLKQLYITQEEARALPILVEAILALAKEMKAEKVYANSHQPMVDILLESLQFHPQAANLFPEYYQNEIGKWWSYQVSS